MRRIAGAIGVLVVALAWATGPAAAQQKPNVI
jgi:hypothetical protein